MDISGKNVKVWRKDIEGRNGTFYRYSVSVSSKREDGSYTTEYLPIRFAKRANMPERITNGARVNFSGFLSVNERPGMDGNTIKELQIIAMKAELMDADDGDPTEGVDSFEQAEDDIPFN